jgi:hypothetical protein
MAIWKQNKFMENHSNEPEKPKTRPVLALFLGFTPAAMLIALVSGLGRNVRGTEQNTLLWVACMASVGCCFISSGLLLRRGTGAAIAGAILLMLLNTFIAFFFGCCATFKF